MSAGTANGPAAGPTSGGTGAGCGSQGSPAAALATASAAADSGTWGGGSSRCSRCSARQRWLQGRAGQEGGRAGRRCGVIEPHGAGTAKITAWEFDPCSDGDNADLIM
jgi:hypothetical protein